MDCAWFFLAGGFAFGIIVAAVMPAEGYLRPPKERPDLRRQIWTHRMAAFASIMAIVSIAFSGWGWGVKLGVVDSASNIKTAQAVLIVLWTVLPPVWLFIEHMWIHSPNNGLSNIPEGQIESAKLQFEIAKYRQDLASKVWLALVSSLLVMYFWKDLSK